MSQYRLGERSVKGSSGEGMGKLGDLDRVEERWIVQPRMIWAMHSRSFSGVQTRTFTPHLNMRLIQLDDDGLRQSR
jgi:hypothetical protein